ncbi:hypothetical protein SPRG_02421 [Saprolegnia parasitica CBS 223.65]|uniref:Magnesium transporter n=1 Tax=Saprolegnia parasitica (strain CBS 223.65) TaxID=695850 RepID=A0A067CQH3_SAPPC|nr:hypothetical protein SPRG_02421 [Saprolegnia parasitica CBS 223.65]KDO32723.1 hypothetical protein SPRG_02421 [Saprolegnia parasitica CBS 223.65]|eukprot:XP_012196387.1 hypothetical protein SPRG_02421 [Saprolegnia parasitica CBS 223.65]
MDATPFAQAVTPSFRRTAAKSADANDFILVPDMLASRHRDIAHNTEPLPRNGKRLALRFADDGSMSYEEISRADVLKMVQANANDMSFQRHQVQLPIPGNDPRRRSKSLGLPVFGTSDVASIHVRDMRKLDSTFSISNEPSFVVRKQAILINTDPLRSVVLRNCCYVFLPDGADGLISTLKQHFKEPIFGDDPKSMPFEFRALEAILATMVRMLAVDCDRVIPIAQTAMDKISQSQVRTKELERLRTLKNVLNELKSQSWSAGQWVASDLIETLEDEYTLHYLYLTKMMDTPCYLPDGSWSYDSECAEALLETYLQEMYNQRARIELTMNNIENTESIVMMQLDATRNSLLSVDLSLTSFTTFINVSTFVTGAFGMNLNSSLQDVDGLFFILLGVLAVFPVVAYISFKLYFVKRGIVLLG